MTSSARSQPRPLTPHLRIYRLTLTMMMSIAHRITGASLYLGTLLLAWWLLAAAKGPETYATFKDFADGWLGKVILLGYTWAIIHHLLGGLRHLVWDTGRGLDLRTANFMARTTLVGSIALTALVWIIVTYVKGAI